MLKQITIKLTGLDKAIKDVKAYGEEVKRVAEQEFIAGAVMVMNKAKQYAPVDEGMLRNSITYAEDAKDRLKKYVIVGAFYGPYIEFGTGSRTVIPANYQAFAAQFKGSAGKG